MLDDVRKNIDLKLNVFEEYFDVPDEYQSEMEGLVNDMNSLGEECQDTVEYERRYAAEGLMERYNALFPHCIPKKHKMTKAEKRSSMEKTAEMLNDDKNNIITSELKDAKDMILTDIKDDLIAKNRERMIENETFDDYTRMSNAVEDTGRLLGFLGKKFKK